MRWIGTHSARIACLLICTVAGCARGQLHPSLVDPDPSASIPAMKALSAGDSRSLKVLVDKLGSDDPAIRLYAIGSLRRLTHQTLGYRCYDTDEQRAAAQARWFDWLGHRTAPASEARP